MTVVPIRSELSELFEKLKEAAPSVPFSDDDFALKFAAKHKDQLRHVFFWGYWLIWDGRVWLQDDKMRVFNFARELCREEIATLKEEEQKKSLASHRTVAAVVSLAKSDPYLAAGIDQWDAHEFLLNTPDGIIDLKSGEMLKDVIRLEYYMTRITSASPDDTGCPRFLQFLKEITNEDQELVDFLQRVFGYCLTGTTREHAMFFFYGTGANGKSVLLSVISYILKDYQRPAPMDALIATNTERHPTDTAGLVGRRLVTATETEQGRR